MRPRTLAFVLVCCILACARATPPPKTVADGSADAAPEAAEVAPAPEAAAEVASEAASEPAGPESRPAEPLPAPAAPMAAEPEPARDPGPIILRVGLASDLDEAVLPCCAGEPVLEMDDGSRVAIVEPLVVRPAARRIQRPVFRLQVAALKSPIQAEELAQQLQRQTGEPASYHFDAGVDLYRVRLGRFASRTEARAAQGRLRLAALEGAWVVREGGLVEAPALLLAQGQHEAVIEGRWITVAPTRPEQPLRVLGKTYRGKIRFFLNERGGLNVVNVVPLEEYLRGVVPEELGPALYPRIEALKAQAVAARTYTLRNLAEFEAEGYDICATPRCQVYGGAAVEHPLSDRAIRETADQVVTYEGRLVDALFSATCGGHTEDGGNIFEQKSHPYLRGVPCMEGGETRLGSPAGGRTLAPAVQAAYAEGETLAPVADLEWGTYRFFSSTHSTLTVGRGLGTETLQLPRSLETYHLRDRRAVPSGLALAAGDPVRLAFRQGRPAALVHELDPREVKAHRPSPRSRWSHFRSDSRLARLVEERFPGLGFRGFEVLERGRSGRATRLRINGRGQQRIEVNGLDIRWVLDLPDTSFRSRRVQGGGKGSGYRFEGTGWGHGVGLCQIGSFGMAGRGLSYRDILTHYYSGAKLARVRLKS